jgi:hypothetical protein
MYLNDKEEYVMLNGFKGNNLGILRYFLYADDIMSVSEIEDLQKGLPLLKSYCDRLTVQSGVDSDSI